MNGIRRLGYAASANYVEKEHDQSYDEQYVDQASADAHAEAQQP